MFRKELEARLKRIFELPKVSFDVPGDSLEQDTLFVSIQIARNAIKDQKQVSKVTGKLTIYGNSDKLPFGYLSKKIHEASLSDTRGFCFYDLEENRGTFSNIAERSASFVFLYSGQYDPAVGEINELSLNTTES